MDGKKTLKSLGLGKNLAYGLLIQSILVILTTLYAIHAISYTYVHTGFSLLFIYYLFFLLSCLFLIVYSFYGYNKKHQNVYFLAIVIFYALALVMYVCSLFITTPNFIAYIALFQFLLVIYFLTALSRSYIETQYVMLGIMILAIILAVLNIVLYNVPVVDFLEFLVIPFSIALTYYARVKRGQYPNLDVFN